MKDQSSTNARNRDIAIVGMDCLLPGARNLREFWTNIIRKKDCITDIPSTHWDIDDYYDPDLKTPDKTYCKRGGFLPTVDFDPLEYGLAPKDLDVTDSAQLLGMMVAKNALKDAGYLQSEGGRDFDSDRCSVILGTTSITELSTPLNMRLATPVIQKILDQHGLDPKVRDSVLSQYKSSFPIWQENSFPGVLGNVVSGRIASHLDLGGTNCVLDAACASALGAVKMAVDSLLTHSCDMAITGGVDTINNVFMYLCFSKTPAFSKAGKSRPFDRDSDGILIAEGIALMVLKRYEDALRDEDRIYALIKAVGSSSDGRSKSVYQPVSEGQSKAIRQSHDLAGISPQDIELIEAHGTGTAVGDVVELKGLESVFGAAKAKEAPWCALGSVKSQIGHAKACAGVAGLMKASLAIYHKVLPPTINIENPSPELDLDQSAFYLNTDSRPWASRGENHTRMAGTSAFGFGGTNFHVTLSEDKNSLSGESLLNPASEIFIFQGSDPKELKTQIQTALEEIELCDDFHGFARYNQHQFKQGSSACATVVAENFETLQKSLKDLSSHLVEHPQKTWSSSGSFYLPGEEFQSAGVALLFPGQGSQYPCMQKAYLDRFPKLRELLDQIEIKRSLEGKPALLDFLYPQAAFSQAKRNQQREALRQTENAQVSLGFVNLAVYEVLRAAGVQSDVFAGHSFGELTALHCAGVLSQDSYFELVGERGRCMKKASKKNSGSMAAVSGSLEKIRTLLYQFNQDQKTTLVLANENGPTQGVLSGAPEDLKIACRFFEEQGLSTRPLEVSAAFHSPSMAEAAQNFKKALGSQTFHKAKKPVYSNAMAAPYPESPQAICEVLGEHLTEPVRFVDEIQAMYQAGVRVFIEAGPGAVLSSLTRSILKDRPHLVLSSDAKEDVRDPLLPLSLILARLIAMHKVDFQAAFFGARVELPKRRKLSPAAVKLNGANYLKPETREAPHRKPAVEFRVATQEKTAVERLNPGKRDLQKAPKHVPSPPPRKSQSHQNRPPIRPSQASHSGRAGLEGKVGKMQDRQGSDQKQEFNRYRMKMLEVHEQFLQMQTEANRVYERMLFQENSSHTGSQFSQSYAEPSFVPAPEPDFQPPAPVVNRVEPVAPVAPRVNPNPTPPLSQRVPNQEEKNGSLLSSMFQPRNEPVSEPGKLPPVPKEAQSLVGATSAQTPASGEILETLKQTIADRTGFPLEMIQDEMKLEEDLAVDSIRRVEILGMIQEKFPAAPVIGPSQMGVLTTVAEIAQFLEGEPAQAVQSEETVEESPAPMSEANTRGAGGSSVEILSELLHVISEKTGFPLEMIKPEMHLEMDLAVDSIRRVEILGAIREKFPKPPVVGPSEMGVLNTISDLVGFLSESVDGLLSGAEDKKKTQLA